MARGIGNADVLAATECVMPCFEIVDSRIRDWKIRISRHPNRRQRPSCGVFVLGDSACRSAPRRPLDLRHGARVRTARRSSPPARRALGFGHRSHVAVRLVNTLGALGIGLKAGEVILFGALAAMFWLKAGDNFPRPPSAASAAARACSTPTEEIFTTNKIKCALIGPGNIGTDLLAEAQRNQGARARADDGRRPRVRRPPARPRTWA